MGFPGGLREGVRKKDSPVHCVMEDPLLCFQTLKAPGSRTDPKTMFYPHWILFQLGKKTQGTGKQLPEPSPTD